MAKKKETEMKEIALMDMGIQTHNDGTVNLIFPSQDCNYVGVLTVTPRRAYQLAEFILSQVNKMWPKDEGDCGCCPHCCEECEEEDEE